jgi:hypothetical protein
MTPKGRELHARWTKSNGAPNAQTGLRVIDRCPKGKAKAQWARFGFSPKEHQCAKGEDEGASAGPAMPCVGKVSEPSPKSVCRLDFLGDFDCIEQVYHGVLSRCI